MGAKYNQMGKNTTKCLEIALDGGKYNQMGENTTGVFRLYLSRCKVALGLSLSRCNGFLRPF